MAKENVIYLQYYNKYGCRVSLDITTGKVGFYLKKDNPDIFKELLYGFFCEVDGMKIFFYRRNNILFLKVNDKEIMIHDNVRSKWTLKGHVKSNDFYAKFILLERKIPLFKGKEIYALKYKPFTNRKIIPGDETPFITEEDYDFIIFIHNVLNDKYRRRVLFSKEWQDVREA